MKQHAWMLATALLLIAALVAACGSTSEPEPTDPGVVRGKAIVEEIEILILESFPVQVNVVARGYVPDGCTEIDEILQKRTDTVFEISITTTRPAEAMCDQAIKNFEDVISLDVAGLKAGTYTVDVNGVIGSFELAVDNVLQEG